MLEAALERLPAEQRAVFVLRVFEELSYQEIAEALDIPIGTVMSRLSRARERLRERPAALPRRGRQARGRRRAVSEHVRERLSAFLDGELPSAERAEVEAHLESCPECAAAARGAGRRRRAGPRPARARTGRRVRVLRHPCACPYRRPAAPARTADLELGGGRRAPAGGGHAA